MRPLALLLAAVAPFAYGDDAAIRLAWANLRENPVVALRTEGTITQGARTLEFRSALWYQAPRPDAPRARVEIWEEVRDGENWRTVNRLVGDGANLYRYDFARSTVWATQYADPLTAPAPEEFADHATGLLNRLATAPILDGGYLTRALREVAAGTETAYRSWLPTATPENPVEGITAYEKGDRRFEFRTNELGLLDSVVYQSTRSVGGESRQESWTLTPFTPDESYAPFVPYERTTLVRWRFTSWPG